MRTTHKLMIGISLVALVGVGLVAAQEMGEETADKAERPGHAPFWEACDENITVGECKAQLDAEREAFQQERYEQCVEEKGQEFCDERVAAMESGERPGPRGGPRGHGGHGDRGPQ